MAVRLTIWQEHLAQEVRRLRGISGLTQDDVCRVLGWSLTKLSKVENGNVAISDDDLAVLLDQYEITGKQRKSLEGKNQARHGGWFDFYDENISSDYLDYVRIEDQATKISTYDVAPLLNGLLQTEEYARETISVLAMGKLTTQDIEQRVDFRLRRQQVITRAEQPVELWSVMAETSLSWPVGGPSVMQQQLDHLIELSDLPNVTLQVLPTRIGAHPGMVESFTLLDFAEQHVPEVAYVDGLAENRYTVEPKQVETYDLAMQHVRARALGPEDTRDYLTNLRETITDSNDARTS